MVIKKTIYSKAPTRIDLAGGTVDLWPLYLFLNKPVTLNLGIDLFAEARIEEKASAGTGEVLLRSEDQNLEMKVPWNALDAFINEDSIQAPPALELHFRLLRYFLQKRAELGNKELGFDLVLSTRARSPAGAGLGGSSALAVAIVGALASWVYGEIDPIRDGEKLVEIVKDIETTVIHVPAGVQDYYGAMFGGLQSLKWRAGSHQRGWLPEKIVKGLEERLLLFYSGKSRNSGINNWALFKAFIDNQGDVREKFQKITDATRRLETALLAGNWEAAGQGIAEEWAIRRTLANGITSPEIDRAFAAAAKIASVSGKICGAGGGGCFFILVPSADPAIKNRIRKAIEADGIRALPFQASLTGLEVRTRGA
ncbi:MAG TPA: hypothetical protein DCS07_04920 [Bdellovibrionales bacterium]|nr:MAG: hypothetical protein A2Z97_03970 [Bdellovibrionales bacterium GWB1_52_6]OFZ04872.1 MAG: hypothetical protein A2X97_08820 [Bdellovibrionales bacterium GWA1_52_35]OFZ42318.1 MAG: hypothetical protein A2070_05540 [Bdellovibrionales bacterium GWC1_52_8]HAR41962.1 hypothetical protein [Bdellovibrionales bacterium]HCM38958.1 hypothetical protein [Bdellovibrionales bacterium]